MAVVGADISMVAFGWRLELDTMIGGLSRYMPDRVVGVPDPLNETVALA